MSNKAHVQTAVINGVTPVPVLVEADVSPGMPYVEVLGVCRDLADELSAIVRCAVKACGYTWPERHVTVSLSPLDMPKRGSHLALPVAAAILAATGQVELPKKAIWVGELTLGGDLVHDTRGILAYAAHARDLGRNLFCSCFERMPDSYRERVMGIGSLSDLRSRERYTPTQKMLPGEAPEQAEPYGRAEEAIVGGKSVLVIGEPFAMAPRIREILPPLTAQEALECAAIASCGDDTGIPSLLARARPFRAPDPSTTLAGLLGGGMPVRPGEVTLAHKGVLFLGDIAEWKPSTLRQLDAARRDGHVRIVRQDGAIEMPAAFQIVAYAKPCPCGRYGDPERECTCEVQQVMRYRERIESLGRTMFDATFDEPTWPANHVIDFNDIAEEYRSELL